MTGWRLGWIVAPEELVADLAKLLQYNTSCAPPFVQRAGVAAITQGDDVVTRTVERFRNARDFLVARLHEIRGVEAVAPPRAMYAFFRVDAAPRLQPSPRGTTPESVAVNSNRGMSLDDRQ